MLCAFCAHEYIFFLVGKYTEDATLKLTSFNAQHLKCVTDKRLTKATESTRHQSYNLIIISNLKLALSLTNLGEEPVLHA